MIKPTQRQEHIAKLVKEVNEAGEEYERQNAAYSSAPTAKGLGPMVNALNELERARGALYEALAKDKEEEL